MSTILPKPYSIFQIQNRKSNRILNASCMRSCCVHATLPVLFTGNAVLHVVNGCEFLIWVLDFSRRWSSRPRKYDHRSSSHLKKSKMAKVCPILFQHPNIKPTALINISAEENFHSQHAVVPKRQILNSTFIGGNRTILKFLMR